MSEAPVGRPGRSISSLLIFALGLLLGRLGSQFSDGSRGLFDLVIVALLAVSITMGWRRWARRTVERRRLEQRPRRPRVEDVEP